MCALALCVLGAAPAAGADRKPRIILPDPTAVAIDYQAGLAPKIDGSPQIDLTFCGATVRDNRHVVTAAHCLDGSESDEPGEFVVFTGTFDVTANEGTRQIREVTAITSHPDFEDVSGGNDMALLTLNSDLTLDSSTQPLALIESGLHPPAGTPSVVSGWGNTDPEGKAFPAELQWGRIDVLNDSACGNYENFQGQDIYDSATMLCAGRDVGDPDYWRDACQGDSGGPLARGSTPGAADRLIGIVSFGIGCGDPSYPGIYTRVANPDINSRLGQASPQPRPQNTVPPSISGDATVGSTLTCSPGSWTGTGVTFSYLWIFVPVVDGSPDPDNALAVGDQQQYTAVPEDEGGFLLCRVRARNNNGALAYLSDPVGPVAPSQATPPPPPNVDLTRPTSRVTRARCRRRRCSITLLVSDQGGIAGMRIRATRQQVRGCPRGRRGRRCRRVRSVRARNRGAGIFQITTGRLRRGRHRFTMRAIDASGNTQARPARVTLRVR